jgi:hypothetical protein
VPWLKCNCAGTPPTMPTCRGEHLQSCPVAFYDYVLLMERQAEAARQKQTPPPTHHGRQLPDVGRAIHGAELMTLRVIRALLEGRHIEGEADAA